MLSSGAILALGVPKPPAAGATVNLAGGLAPSVSFSATLTVGNHLVTSFTPTTEYDTFAGRVGMLFALTANMTFNQIGMRCGTGDTVVVVSVNANDGGFTQIASATIDFSGVATGVFKYVDVPQFTLTGDSATTYTLSADFTATGAGQFWCGSSPADIANKFSLVSVYFNSPPPTQYEADHSYVGLDLNFVVSAGATVDFTGNLGGISSYGRLKYGRGHYSRIDAFAPAFSADLDIVGQDFFVGDLRPVVAFAGDLTFAQDMAGDLAPSVTFAANLGLVIDLAGDMAPQVALGASLAVDLAFEAALDGAFAFTVVLAASSMISGPLWASSEPCPPPLWAPTDSCPPTMWTPIDPCDPVEWEDSELCNG